MLSGGLAEILCRLAEGGEAVFCLPGPANCFEPAAHYGIDGVTEKVMFYLKITLLENLELCPKIQFSEKFKMLNLNF